MCILYYRRGQLTSPDKGIVHILGHKKLCTCALVLGLTDYLLITIYKVVSDIIISQFS